MFTSSHACIPQNENGAVKVKKRSLLGRSSSHGCIYDQSSTFKDFENANENSLCKFYPYFRTTNKLTPRILRCTASTHVHNNSRWLLDLLEYIHKTSNIPKTHTHTHTPKKKTIRAAQQNDPTKPAHHVPSALLEAESSAYPTQGQTGHLNQIPPFLYLSLLLELFCREKYRVGIQVNHPALNALTRKQAFINEDFHDQACLCVHACEIDNHIPYLKKKTERSTYTAK